MPELLPQLKESGRRWVWWGGVLDLGIQFWRAFFRDFDSACAGKLKLRSIIGSIDDSVVGF